MADSQQKDASPEASRVRDVSRFEVSARRHVEAALVQENGTSFIRLREVNGEAGSELRIPAAMLPTHPSPTTLAATRMMPNVQVFIFVLLR